MNAIIKMILAFTAIVLFVTGCADKDKDVYVPITDLVVSPDFDWQTAREVSLSLEVLSNEGQPIEGVVFTVYNGDPDSMSEIVAKGNTTETGKFESQIVVPTYINKLWVVGFMSTVEIPILNNIATYTFGGFFPQIKGGTGFEAPATKNWAYLPGMTFNSSGVPSPMTRDVLSASFLQRIDATLPERSPVPLYHPHYLNPNNQTNIKIDEYSDVWVTFVHEGAGFKNALGFHTYPSDQVPQTTQQVGTRTLVFPNASLQGSGGGLRAGDKVYLGSFQGGTTIGWFLVADGFINGSNVSTTKPVYYSDPHLNPEINPTKKQHSILVYDDQTERLLIGFEDLPRESSGTDDDFNDLIFYVTANPIEAIDLDGVPPIDTPEDRDGDGISDLFDDYPDDPRLAFNNYTFGENSWGTLAFEDLWPHQGDYDLNDMVIDYNVNQITQAGNSIRKVEMLFKLRAIGARNANGFAVEIPFISANISDIEPSHPLLFEHETDGPKAVFRFFNNTFDLIPQVPSGFINTENGSPHYEPVTFGVSFWLNTPVPLTSPNPAPPYNPFIFVSGVRSHEVHLPGYSPTSKMNMSLFGTSDDASTPALGNWYKTSGNLPWAVNIASSWDYPSERSQITRAYIRFKDWAQSSGVSSPDWYLNRSGYRNNEFIYQTP